MAREPTRGNNQNSIRAKSNLIYAHNWTGNNSTKQGFHVLKQLVQWTIQIFSLHNRRCLAEMPRLNAKVNRIPSLLRAMPTIVASFVFKWTETEVVEDDITRSFQSKNNGTKLYSWL